jgi:hypothetical protein
MKPQPQLSTEDVLLCFNMATKGSLDIDPEAIHHSPPVSAAASSSYLDDSYDVYKRIQGIEIDPEEAKKVLPKIDRRIVPILSITYLLQYLDKNGINYASVYGLQKGTKLHGQDYSWLGSLALLWMCRLNCL